MSTTWLASPSCASCWAVSSMAEKQNTPEIRFEGFTDPWEQRKLGDCFEFLKNNTLSRADLNGENGTARNVHYGDILIKFGDCLDGDEAICRSLLTIQCFPNLLGRYFAKVMSFSPTQQKTKRLASVLNCGSYPKSQPSRGCIRYRRDLGPPLGRVTWVTTLIPMHTTDSFFP